MLISEDRDTLVQKISKIFYENNVKWLLMSMYCVINTSLNTLAHLLNSTYRDMPKRFIFLKYICDIVTWPSLGHSIIFLTSSVGLFFILINLSICFSCRCLVCRMCFSRAPPWSTHLSWWQWCWSTSGDHQGARNTNQRTNQRNESTLHWIQISSNQAPPLEQGWFIYLSFSLK